jgi:hypothetical protein
VTNFYRDNPDIRFHLDQLDLERVIALREQGYRECQLFADAPVDQADALDSYDRVLEIVGGIAGEVVAPRAREVDRLGAVFEAGQVRYAPGTAEALERLRQAELMGFTLPRRYGGLNLPKTVYSMAVELISRADASLMNLFGLQEIADTIAKFGSEDQKARFLPRFASGAVTGAMALTEPDAGSDLQSVSLRADLQPDGRWLLSGVKRFITNGCADVLLVMARSEQGVKGGRGISLFIYEREAHMRIRRIEHKLGIHGSPTCELQFDAAPAELLGQRKLGLVRYTMSLMNGARLGVAAQAVGIAEAAWREALGYATRRIQFKKAIRHFPAVYEMLAGMRTRLTAARSLLVETARMVDLKEGLEELVEREPQREAELREELRRCGRLAGMLTPMVKAYASEMANRVCYDALQIHGGVGYTTDFDVERLARDARITNIYEGTTQLQIVAAVGAVMGGASSEYLVAAEGAHDYSELGDVHLQALRLRDLLERAVAGVRQRGEGEFQELHAGRVVALATAAIIARLLCRDALAARHRRALAEMFLAEALPEAESAAARIVAGERAAIDLREIICADDPAGCPLPPH